MGGWVGGWGGWGEGGGGRERWRVLDTVTISQTHTASKIERRADGGRGPGRADAVRGRQGGTFFFPFCKKERKSDSIKII